MLSERLEEQHPGVKLFGIIKEVAPVNGAATDEELGVDEFQTKFFNNKDLYVDHDRKFYEFLGNKSALSQSYLSWNPVKAYTNLKAITAKYNSVQEKNTNGEGIIKGGVLIVTPDQGIVYQHGEMVGFDLPLDEIDLVLKKLVNPDANFAELEAAIQARKAERTGAAADLAQCDTKCDF